MGHLGLRFQRESLLARWREDGDLVGVTGNYTDNKYGWTNIRNAEVVRVRDGYRIKLPRALPID